MTDFALPSEDAGKVKCLDEPMLQFASGQFASDPHDGLALFGPYSLGEPGHPRGVPYMVVGTPEGVEAMAKWSRAMNATYAVVDPKKHGLWPPYPGFEVAFGSRWPDAPTVARTLDRDALLEASRKSDSHERCFAVVQHFMEAFEHCRKHDARVAVAVCVVPDEVWTNCRPKSRVADPSDRVSPGERESRRKGQGDLFEQFDPEQYQLSPDFRRQLKARTMRYDIPLQIIRESTLRLSDENPRGQRRLTALSDRMWNLGAALYYKAGGKPWKLKSARPGVCYIGIAFRRVPGRDKETACCAAQMFLDSGDGIVFLGEFGPWYSPEDEQFHLDRAAATRLLRGVLQTYTELEGQPLSEIFLHCRSSISREEFEGFKEAAPPGSRLVGVRVRADSLGPRLFRPGTRPVIRGTFMRLDDRSGLLFASGFKPRLGTYDGWETPVPLKIDIQHGEADIESVAKDILGLTKLNYNACKLGDGQPVTVGFSDAVGEILISNPTVKDRRQNFKFYI